VTRRRAALVTLLFAVIAAGLFVRLGHFRMWRASEERCFEVVKEMVSSGDWLLPHFKGALRLQKPPLFYWAGAAAAKLAGGHSIVTLRSVSALFGLCLAATVFAVGQSLGGFRTAMLATALLGATALFYERGRTGDAEMLLALLVFGALAVFERLWRTRDSRLLPALAVLVGLGFLTKATAALLGVFPPIAVWLFAHHSLRLTLRPAVLAWGFVAAAIGLSWYAAILLFVPDSVELFRSFLLSPLGVQAGTDATHLREIYYYLPRFPLTSAATGLLLPWLAYEGWKQRLWRSDPRLCFFATSFVVTFLAWTLVPQKQMHYLLPLAPLQALVAARVIEQRFLDPRVRSSDAK
jgi:4-amino-4-deoxy-L-arabinose transferase-like glycosyltransferase